MREEIINQIRVSEQYVEGLRSDIRQLISEGAHELEMKSIADKIFEIEENILELRSNLELMDSRKREAQNG